MWSGKRDSNSQPSAWKADALAVELFPPVCRSPLTARTASYSYTSVKLVVGGGFEPPKSYDDRFTVCSLWPLGNPSTLAEKSESPIFVQLLVELAMGLEPATC